MRAKKEARPSRAKGKKAAAAVAVTVAAEEEAAGVAAGLMEAGTLTGQDRGTEPTPDVPVQGKVATGPNVPATKVRSKKAVAEASAPKAVEPVAVEAVAPVPVRKVSASKEAAPPALPAQKNKTVPPPAPKKGGTPLPDTTKLTGVKKPAKATSKQVVVVVKSTQPASNSASKKATGKGGDLKKSVAPNRGVDRNATSSVSKSKAGVKVSPAKKSIPVKKATPVTARSAAARTSAAKKTAAKKAPVKATAAKKQAPAKKTAARR